MDLVCGDVFDYIATAEVLLSRIESWTYPLKLSFHCWLRKLLVQLESYWSTVGSEHTSNYVEEDMELDIPGKKNSYLRSIFEGKKVRNSFPGNMAVSFIMPNSFPRNGANLVTAVNFFLQTPSNK